MAKKQLTLVEFVYNGKHRVAEAYSHRTPKKDRLLYAFEVGGEHIKSFRVKKIAKLKKTDKPFAPRWRVEV